MTTTSTELSVELIEDVLKEKEAALAKELAVIEDLKRVLHRMGYELVPTLAGKSRKGRSLGVPGSPPTGSAITGRGRGRPRKEGSITPLSGEGAPG